MQTKLCPRCMVEKPLSEFPIDRRRKSGRHPYCKEDCRALQKEWRQDYPERYKAANNRYYVRKKKKAAANA